MEIKVKKLVPQAELPTRMTEDAAGFDLYCLFPATILPHNLSSSATTIHTGIAIELPKGYYAEVVLRSSVGKNTKLRLANQVGIIDSDYRGEILLYVENTGNHMEIIHEKQRIAQLLIKKCEDVVLTETDVLSDTERGTSGSGSTGTGAKRTRKTATTNK